MRVLQVLPSLDQSYGGPVRLVLDVSSRCLGLGLDSEILGFGPPNLPDNSFPSEKTHALDRGFPHSYVRSSGLRAWLDKNLDRFDAVVCHGAWTYPTWTVARACRVHELPYAVFPHGMLDPWSVLGQGAIKAAKKRIYWWWRECSNYQAARCVFFTTQRERALTNRVFRLRTNQVVLTPYGIEESITRINRPRCVELQELSAMDFALFLGRIHPKKNLEFLMRAWAAAGVPESWRLVVAGPGEASYVQRLRDLAANLGVDQRVLFTGFVSGEDKAYLLQRARWFLLPSQQENFGVAVLEAISHGCSVAISDQVYIAESFRERSEVLPLALGAWRDFLRIRMPDANWREEVLRKDRQHLDGQFGMSHIARNWASTLQRELSY